MNIFMNDFFDLLDEEEQTASDRVLEESLQFLAEKNIIKLDKATARRRLLSQATLYAAKEEGSPLYAKYVKASKLRKQYRQEIQSRYQKKGEAKLRQFLKNQKTRKNKQQHSK